MSLEGQSCLAIVPARGGSKGIPHKNLVQIAGKSLIQIVGELVGELDWIDQAILSSDSPQMIEEGCRYGLPSIFERPMHLSNDRASAMDVCSHALFEAERYFRKVFDFVLYLEPTSPFRRPRHIERIARKLIEGNYDHVLSVSPTDSKSHPLKQFVLNDKGKFSFYDEHGKHIIARQQLKTTYHRNGVAYAFSRRVFDVGDGFKWEKWTAEIIDEQVVNIDTFFDLKLARFLWDHD